MASKKSEEYTLLNGSDETSEVFDGHVEEFTHEQKRRTSSGLLFYLTAFCIYVLSVFGAGTGGYQYGRSVTNVAHGEFLNPDITPQAFKYNRSMAEAPTEENDAMWESMYPGNGGFFHHETIAPEGASLAAFHQLHCLDGIRHAYWVAHDALVENRTLDFDSLPDYSTPWHTRHCIDFLRQMLMCNADITIEHVDPKAGGIFGFGLEHQCRRWDQLYNWVRDKQIRWENRPENEPTTSKPTIVDEES